MYLLGQLCIHQFIQPMLAFASCYSDTGILALHCALRLWAGVSAVFRGHCFVAYVLVQAFLALTQTGYYVWWAQERTGFEFELALVSGNPSSKTQKPWHALAPDASPSSHQLPQQPL